LFPFGWGELWGIADRTDYDLKRHSLHSKEDLSYFDPIGNKKYVPFCIEPALGADRAALVFLCDAYDEEQVAEGDMRTVLRFHPAIAPVKIGVLPLSKKLSDAAYAVYRDLARLFMCEFDDTGSIGKRYRRQDEIGTPYCITYDFESENDRSVTIRERDSMDQERLPISGLAGWFAGKFDF
jgi:glycyl-tRNA synthetase